ncbi:hypothetical protein FKP32DRAFT_217839 [Trametes sanguinea]|nr:hypothetical protein FKP32DRAFT_217839 [Trametes sanguinea]
MGLSPPAADSQALELSFVRSPPQPINIVLSSISCGGLDQVPVLYHCSGFNAWASKGHRVYIPSQQSITAILRLHGYAIPIFSRRTDYAPESSHAGSQGKRIIASLDSLEHYNISYDKSAYVDSGDTPSRLPWEKLPFMAIFPIGWVFKVIELSSSRVDSVELTIALHDYNLPKD